LRVVLIGTEFDARVWEALLSIPLGRLTSYSDIAAKVCNPAAARAVGAAVGAIRSASWCRAPPWLAATAASPAITGASPASAPCWAGKPEMSA